MHLRAAREIFCWLYFGVFSGELLWVCFCLVSLHIALFNFRCPPADVCSAVPCLVSFAHRLHRVRGWKVRVIPLRCKNHSGPRNRNRFEQWRKKSYAKDLLYSGSPVPKFGLTGVVFASWTTFSDDEIPPPPPKSASTTRHVVVLVSSAAARANTHSWRG